ncbi:maltose alpha-D-glucosyltransferase [Catalinimonas niigatensis]|uniref:maltose alpha-D-glucosyltransferase n=1 Tax=Catalinimonas niigatensis TaxID=1397264 RepID=UPI002666AA43|nr:maltose alpha-D-glucosyltransferase [Catalinimonas niigatensis]WPP50883.1 maltose alpha-D-glucosyltransferase [Catalinimonas niigatensis]
MAKTIQLDDKIHWYKDAVIYELHIKAFKDSNGDGIGDFRGLLEKLDYLQDLGVTTIWLLPFYPSPLRDDGYDIMDYYSINPNYGNVQDFKKFMKQAKQRGLRVITELVINHTSDQHPWFQRARRAKPGSVERDFYVWSDTPDKYSDVRIIFQDYEASNWTWDPVAQSYYWHRFFHHQPDLNYDNPAVVEEIFKVMDFWVDTGVDGFRLDAVPYLFERDGTNCENLPETHAFLKKLRKHIEKKRPGTLLLAEANMWPEDSASYFGDGDECQMNYHFPIMPRMFMAVRMEDRYPITDILDQTPEIPETCQWAMFLRNHDELTLEMVTDEERDYMYKVYTKDPLAKINLGIRHRLAPLLDNDRKKIELMNHLLLSLPGTPVIYYGDEIGMGDNYYLGDRDGVRTPMQWSPDRNAGFSDTNPQQLYLPVILDPEYQYEAVNVETQQKNSNSLLWWMKRHISMRKKHKAFSRGDINFLSAENAKVLAFTRTYEGETILVLVNLSRFSQPVELDLENFKDHIPIEIFSRNKFPRIGEQSYLFTLAPHGYEWFLLKKPENLELVGDGLPENAIATLSEWSDLFKPKTLNAIEGILPQYLMKCRWFGGKARVVQSISIVHKANVPLTTSVGAFLIIEVSYNEGLNEFYQMPVSFIAEEFSEFIRSNFSHGLIAPIVIDGQKGFLYDAVYNEAFRQAMFQLMVKKKKGKENGSDLIGSAAKAASKLWKEKNKDVKSKVLNAEQSNTSIIYEKDFFFKLYRKIDAAMNPDLEITRFLTETAKFQNVPNYVGALELDTGKPEKMVLGMMQNLVENQGDAWTYMGDVVRRYFERVLIEQTEHKSAPPLKGTLINPVDYEKIPDRVKEFMGGIATERAALLGIRTAEMHLALSSSNDDKDFKPEAFSLHYQRSVFSSLQTSVRGTFQILDKTLKKLDEPIRGQAEELKAMRKDILKYMQQIYAHKINTMKIRTHGDYHLGQVLFTGRDFIILDFEGEPARAYSERRLKRSPLRDVAGMIRSFHYAAYNGLFRTEAFTKGEAEYLDEWAEQWYHYMSGIFMKAYIERCKGSNFLPDSQEDLDTLLQTFLLEKAVYELGYELNNRPSWATIPMKGIKYIMDGFYEEESKKSSK